MTDYAAPVSLDSLAEGASALYGKDFLLSWDHGRAAIEAVLTTATILETAYAAGRDARYFRTGLALSLFRDKSTRTRFAFASAANLLGLGHADLDETQSQIAHGETTRETATMISFLAQAVGIRDDMFVHEGHRFMVEFAAALEEGSREGVLPNRPAVVNLQCDLDHPTQTVSDLLHLSRELGGLEPLRGRKLAMTWAYSPSYGKPLSVPQGIIALMTRYGMQVTLAHPEGYDLVPETLDIARRNAEESGGLFEVTHSLEEAFEEADVVYPKSWAPLTIMEERTHLLRTGDQEQLAALERQCLETNAIHKAWECNEVRMEQTRFGRGLYMHCLPADITGVSCAAGEVAADVFECHRLATYRQASHKPFVVAAMMLLSRCADPVSFLRPLTA